MLKITEMLIYHESFSAIIGCLLTTRTMSHRDPHASAPRDTPLAAATHRDGSVAACDGGCMGGKGHLFFSDMLTNSTLEGSREIIVFSDLSQELLVI